MTILARLKDFGIDLDGATNKLEEEGVQKFAKAFGGLMKAIKEKQSVTQYTTGNAIRTHEVL